MYTGKMNVMSRLVDLEPSQNDPRIVRIFFMGDESTSVDSLTVKLCERAQSRTRQTMSLFVNAIRRSVIETLRRSVADSESGLKARFFQQLSISFSR